MTIRWSSCWPTCAANGGVERLSLSGLDHAGVAAFMEQAAGHDLDDEELLSPGPSTRRPRETPSSCVRSSAT